MWVNRRGRFDRISRVLWTDAECALKAAHDSANRAAYNRTNWPGGIVSNVRAMGDSVGNPLRMGSQSRTQHHYRSSDKEDSGLHGKDLVRVIGERVSSSGNRRRYMSEIASEDRLPRRITGNAIPAWPSFRDIYLSPFFNGPEPAFSAAVASDFGNPAGTSSQHSPTAAWTGIRLPPNLLLERFNRQHGDLVSIQTPD
jgi:hypothetical protein